MKQGYRLGKEDFYDYDNQKGKVDTKVFHFGSLYEN